MRRSRQWPRQSQIPQAPPRGRERRVRISAGCHKDHIDNVRVSSVELVVNIEKVRKLPDSKDAMREVMVQELIKKGFWEEIATLNSISVNPKIKNNAYSRELMDFLSDYIYEDQESSRVTVRKSKKN